MASSDAFSGGEDDSGQLEKDNKSDPRGSEDCEKGSKDRERPWRPRDPRERDRDRDRDREHVLSSPDNSPRPGFVPIKGRVRDFTESHHGQSGRTECRNHSRMCDRFVLVYYVERITNAGHMFLCPFCSYQNLQEPELKIHIITKHIVLRERVFQC